MAAKRYATATGFSLPLSRPARSARHVARETALAGSGVIWLTVRMSLRRFTRLTNAFSKKLENLKAALGLHFCWYNFCRIHQTLRVTPAMEAGIAGHIWTLEELVGLLEIEKAKRAA